MNKQTSLKIIFWISLIGILFSGYLSFSEIFLKNCVLGACIKVGPIPSCVFGLLMYIIIFIVSIRGTSYKEVSGIEEEFENQFVDENPEITDDEDKTEQEVTE